MTDPKMFEVKPEPTDYPLGFKRLRPGVWETRTRPKYQILGHTFFDVYRERDKGDRIDEETGFDKPWHIYAGGADLVRLMADIERAHNAHIQS